MRKVVRNEDVRQEAKGGGLAEALREGLRALVVTAGLHAMQDLLEQERRAVCGPRYAHQPERQASRAGHARGELVLGGRRVAVKRPRARTNEGREVVLPSWELAARQDPLHERAFEQMVVGVATRRYDRSLEAVPESVEVRGTSKSAVSRRFVSVTRAKLSTWLARGLGDIDLTALMIDGVHFAEHVVLVALGIDASGAKHVLGLWEGATENAAACTSLLGNLRERGIRTDRSLLVTIDGSKALAKAVRDVFGARALIQRCQVHKKRNVLDQLPEKVQPQVKAAITEAYRSRDADRARWLLTLAKKLEADHPGAAASLREGLDETLTVMRLQLPRALERTLSTTNAIENLMGRARSVTRNVKRWRGGEMILRWMAAAASEAEKGFRRLKGHAGVPKLVTALRKRDVRIEAGEKEIDGKETAA